VSDELPAGGGTAGDILDRPDAGRALIRGGVLRIVGYVATIGVTVVTYALLTRHLGVSRFGQYTTVTSLVALVAIVTDSGMSTIGTREYATLEGTERTTMMRSLLGLRIALTLVGVGLTLAWSLAVGYGPSLVIGAVVASLATVALVIQHTLTIPLTTELRLGTVSALDFSRLALQMLGIVILIALGAGLAPLLAVTLPAYALIIIPTALLARHRISLRPSLRISDWPALMRVTLVYSLATAVGTMYVFAAQLLTSLVATHHQSGLFAVSFRIFIVSAGVPGLVVASALPVLSRAARDNRDRLAYILQRIFDASLIGGVGCALVMAAGAGFAVSVVGGPKYASAAPVLELQSFAMIASFLVAGWSYGLISLHLHRSLVLTNVSALVVSVALTLILAPSDGAQGAAIATLASESVLAATSLVALAWSRPQFRPHARVVLKVLGAGAVAAAAGFVPAMSSLTRAIVVAIVYGVIILATRALPEEFRELLPRRWVRI
jgi:O-antigen/teichoic acid export membrane protein